jgi:molybdate transport system substrate-binding protein
MATRHVLGELAGSFQRRFSVPVEIESVGGVIAAKRVQAGEDFDVVVLAADAIDALIEAGKVVATKRVAVARAGVAVAVRSGAPRLDIGSEAALRRAVESALSISYSTGPSGTHLQKLFERWGMADEIAQRTVQAPPGVPVGSLIADGRAELGFQQLSELIHLDGIVVLGPLSDDVQNVTVFTAALTTVATQPDQAAQWLEFLASAETDEVKERNGMMPAR